MRIPSDIIERFPAVTSYLTQDVMFNFMKSVDIRLIEPMPDVEITISTRYEFEIFIDYKCNDKIVSVCVASTYVIVHKENETIMMYEGDGEDLSVKERLFSTIMSILGSYRG